VLKAYTFPKTGGLERLQNRDEILKAVNENRVIWIDVREPTKEDFEFLQKEFNFKEPPKEVFEDIEISSRFYEGKDYLYAVFSFLVQHKDEVFSEPVLFYLKNNVLITLRYKKIVTFSMFKRIVFNRKLTFSFPDQILTELLNLEVERIGNRLELIGRRIRSIRKQIFEEQSPDIIKDLAFLDELNLTLRESINEKLRILHKLSRSTKLNNTMKRELKLIVEDLHSLADYSTIYMEKIDSVQESLLGLITIKQNETSQVFAFIATLFLPPTLIASIYGMNFDFIPFLHNPYGFWISLFLMVSVTGGMLLWLKLKKVI
jgi:magnesium transporter